MTDITIGTAGHIDHGKTALVRALTGINTDRLSEEKQRGITIDIGFAHMILDSFRIGFIDVPGHERFVKNMLSGIGGIRLLLLVIAADESVMPQTIEHLQICNLLGIPGGIIVITRTGLADPELVELVAEEARDTCKGTFLESSPVVCVDSLSGDGIEELKNEISRQVKKLDQDDHTLDQRTRQVTRLPIDRVFTMKGFGTVVTGTLLSGSLRQDSQVSAYPPGQADEIFKIRSIEVFNQKEKTAVTGQRTAVNLAGASRDQLQRGMILSVPGKMEAARIIDTEVYIHPESPSHLLHRQPVRLHHGSGECIARVYLLDQKSITPGEKGLVQLRLDTAILGFPGDRFILRRYSPATTIGGGIILHNNPRHHRKKDLEQLLPRLQKLALSLTGSNPKALQAMIPFLLEEKGITGTNISGLSARSGETIDVIKDFLKTIQHSILISEDQVHVASRKALYEAVDRIVAFLEDFHAKHPLSEGVPRQEIYGRFLPGLAPPLYQRLLSEMEDIKLVTLLNANITGYGHSPKMSSGHQELKEKIVSLFSSFHPGKESPGTKTILDLPGLGKEGRDVFYHMLTTGDLLKINEDFLATPEQMRNVIIAMRKAFDPAKPFQVGTFKDLFDISRKHAIPLLEYLDREGITKRSGNDRVIIDN
jgi:selenocysteine-specific elongation factor